MPVLVVGARQDQIMPTVGTPYLASLIPDQRLHWIERCGHLPMLERPAIYHRLLRQFLRDETMKQ
jgi:pimeloyl-ACP methyl ester carboxylesterase